MGQRLFDLPSYKRQLVCVCAHRRHTYSVWHDVNREVVSALHSTTHAYLLHWKSQCYISLRLQRTRKLWNNAVPSMAYNFRCWSPVTACFEQYFSVVIWMNVRVWQTTTSFRHDETLRRYTRFSMVMKSVHIPSHRARTVNKAVQGISWHFNDHSAERYIYKRSSDYVWLAAFTATAKVPFVGDQPCQYGVYPKLLRLPRLHKVSTKWVPAVPAWTSQEPFYTLWHHNSPWRRRRRQYSKRRILSPYPHGWAAENTALCFIIW
jgi:hypothetical protein